MPSLVSKFLRPDKPPSPEFEPSSDWVAYCLSIDQAIVFEVFLRSAGIFGVRGFAWVAWRDTAGQARGHSWHELNSVPVIVVDDVETAQNAAREVATAHHLDLLPWSIHSP
jgi:hypothetical protein